MFTEGPPTSHALAIVTIVTHVTQVYRGLTDKKLPQRCLQKDSKNVQGGIDFAFMSTTKKREVRVTGRVLSRDLT